MEERKLNSKFEVGDFVLVTDSDYSYRLYDDWFKKYAPDYLHYKRGDYCDNRIGVVVAIGEHGLGDRMLYLIKFSNDDVALMDERGLTNNIDWDGEPITEVDIWKLKYIYLFSELYLGGLQGTQAQNMLKFAGELFDSQENIDTMLNNCFKNFKKIIMELEG